MEREKRKEVKKLQAEKDFYDPFLCDDIELTEEQKERNRKRDEEFAKRKGWKK